MSTYRQASQSQANRRDTERKRHPLLRIRYIALILICGWAVFDYSHNIQPQLVQLRAQHQELQSQLNSLKGQYNSLQKQKKELNSDSYIEKYAAEQYGLTKPNQVPFNLQNGTQNG